MTALGIIFQTGGATGEWAGAWDPDAGGRKEGRLWLGPTASSTSVRLGLGRHRSRPGPARSAAPLLCDRVAAECGPAPAEARRKTRRPLRPARHPAQAAEWCWAGGRGGPDSASADPPPLHEDRRAPGPCATRESARLPVGHRAALLRAAPHGSGASPLTPRSASRASIAAWKAARSPAAASCRAAAGVGPRRAASASRFVSVCRIAAPATAHPFAPLFRPPSFPAAPIEAQQQKGRRGSDPSRRQPHAD